MAMMGAGGGEGMSAEMALLFQLARDPEKYATEYQSLQSLKKEAEAKRDEAQKALANLNLGMDLALERERQAEERSKIEAEWASIKAERQRLDERAAKLDAAFDAALSHFSTSEPENSNG